MANPSRIDLFVTESLYSHLDGLKTPFKVTPVGKNSDFEKALGNRNSEDSPWILVATDAEMAVYAHSKIWSTESIENHAGGVILISSKLDATLENWGAKLPILDVTNEKEFKQNHESLFARATSQWERWNKIRAHSASPYSLKRLNEIFLMLSAERDPKQLLAICLRESILMTQATAGILYQIEERDGELTFVQKFSGVSGNNPMIEGRPIKIIENSLCGYTTLTAKALITSDVSRLKSLAVPTYNRNVDFADSDDIHSLLTVPFRNRRNENIAVIQLVNKRSADGQQAVFGTEDENLVASLGTQTATCLETVELYEDVQRLFDGFVKASISAIESRDPSTGGHSERVARICVALAQATTDCESGIYRSVRFREEEMRELEYAALLHDFGKIGVREEVLVKAKKLYPHQIGQIQERIRLARAVAQIQMYQKAGGKGKADEEYKRRLMELENYWATIQKINEPGVILSPDDYKTLTRIKAELLPIDGAEIPLLSTEEFEALSIESGSLTDAERLEIESHVRHTYQYLKMIPWTKDFRHLTEIAYCHHEKLDGTGYPRGLLSHEIPLQSKIMTIADIYDALTSADRWYKEAMPVAKALDILKAEVAEGKIDPVLFELFLDKRIWQLTQGEHSRTFGT